MYKEKDNKKYQAASYFNIAALLLSFVMLFVLFPKKTLNYDEPYQIMCSKGITLMNVDKFSGKTVLTSDEFNKENTIKNVFFEGTDSIHYMFLHFFILLSGNDLQNYVLFSVIWAILSLTGFYFLCRLILGDSFFVGVAIILLATHIVFISQAYSIRHYVMTLFFVILSGIYFFRYLLQGKKTADLVMLFALCLISFASHYLASYIVAVYIITILYVEKLAFFSKKNILISVLSLDVLLLYYSIHSTPFDSIKNNQQYIQNYFKIIKNISIFDAVSVAMKSAAINFAIVFVLFRDLFIVRLISFLLIVSMYLIGLKYLIKQDSEKFKLHALLLLGICSSLFSGLLSFYTNNIAYFAYRYVVFSVPFAVLFGCYFFKYLLGEPHVKRIIAYGIFALLFSPAIIAFILSHKHSQGAVPCNHLWVINDIAKKDVHKIAVPKVVDAVFINCLLPKHYAMTYNIDSSSREAILYDNNNAQIEKIPLIYNELIVMF